VSQENLALLGRVADTFNGRELDAYLALHDASLEFTPYERAVEGLGPYRGHDGIRAWWESTLEIFPDLTAELHDARSHGNRTFARGRLHGTGAGSGAAFERTLWMAHEWHDSKVVWWHAFDNEADALKAVGLEE